MKSRWRVAAHPRGWAVVCDAPIGLVVEFGVVLGDEGAVSSLVLISPQLSREFADKLNAMEDQVARKRGRGPP